MINEQKQFPYLKEFKDKFSTDEHTIFVFKDTIYTDYPLSYDLLIHEQKHIKQQKKLGAEKWIENYLNDEKFRLKQEIEAYREQLKAIKEKDNKRYARALGFYSHALAGTLYGELIDYPEAIKQLRIK